MKTMTIKEFIDAFSAQGVPREHLAAVCPCCATVQSMKDLMDAGQMDWDKASSYFAFSCIGRWTGAGAPPRNGDSNGRGCDWTLGGLFKIAELEVIAEDGSKHLRFLPATPEQARAHMERVK